MIVRQLLRLLEGADQESVVRISPEGIDGPHTPVTGAWFDDRIVRLVTKKTS